MPERDDEPQQTPADRPRARPHGDDLFDEVDRLAQGGAAARPVSSRAAAGDEAGRAIGSEAELEEDLAELADDLPPRRLLAFYDRLRTRIASGLGARAGRLGPTAADALLLVPDVFILLVRLLLDPETPRQTRALIGGALAYFVLPMDLLPEAFLGIGGFLDDLVLAALVLSKALDPSLDFLVERHWSGPRRLREVLADVVGAAEGLLGEGLYGRVKALLARRGLEV